MGAANALTILFASDESAPLAHIADFIPHRLSGGIFLVFLPLVCALGQLIQDSLIVAALLEKVLAPVAGDCPILGWEFFADVAFLVISKTIFYLEKFFWFNALLELIDGNNVVFHAGVLLD